MSTIRLHKKIFFILLWVCIALPTKAVSITFEEFKNKVEKDSYGVYVVEGDLPILKEEDLLSYFNNVVVRLANGELIINTNDGVDDRWNEQDALNMTYCISTLFNDDHGAVVQAMAAAEADWERSANINFVYMPSEDSNCTNANNNVVFDVSPSPASVSYLARAFFPASPRTTRNILISSAGLNPTVQDLTLVGILRHELGHVLGFRHEHTRPQASAPDCVETNNWRVVTSYDSNSVMHYPQCNGTGGWALNLTALDREGVGEIYPLPNIVTPGFNAEFYLNAYADLRAAFGRNVQAAQNHWINSGIQEGRRGSIEFDVRFYLNHYDDLNAAFGNDFQAALDHWIYYGAGEGRRGSREFDVQYYLSQYADLSVAFGDNFQAAINHWIHNGLGEGRRGSREFDVQYYLSQYADLSTTFGSDFQAALDHWISHGIYEGRSGAAL